MSLIGGSNAFVSFTGGGSTQPINNPAPVSVNTANPTPVVTTPTVASELQVGSTTVDETFIARLVLKDEAVSFQEDVNFEKKFELQNTDIFGIQQNQISEHDSILAGITNEATKIVANKKIQATDFIITNTPTDINIKDTLLDKETRLKNVEDDLASGGSTFNKIETLQNTAVTLGDADTALGDRITPIETSLAVGGTIRNLINTNKTELQESINLINDNLSSGTTFTKIKNIEDDLASGGSTFLKIKNLEDDLASGGTTFTKISNLEGHVTTLNDKTDKLEISGGELLFKIKGDFEEGLISRKVSTFNDLQFTNTEGNLQNLKTSIKNLETATASTPDAVNTLITAHQVTTDLAQLTTDVQNSIDVCSDIKRVDVTGDKKLEIDDEVLFKKQISISSGKNINANGLIRLLGSIQFAGGGGMMFGSNPENPNFEVSATQLENMMEGIQTFTDPGPELNIFQELDSTGESLRVNAVPNSFDPGCPTIFNHTIYLNIMPELTGPQAKLRSKFKNFYINDSREMRERDGGTGKRQFSPHVEKLFFQTEFANLRKEVHLMMAKFKKIQHRDLEDAGGNFIITGTPPSGHSETVIGIRDNEIGARFERFHTTRFIGNVIIGRGTDFHEEGAEDNTEYNLRDFIENINTTIDNRVSNFGTTVGNTTIGAILTRFLAQQNILKFDIRATMNGAWIGFDIPVRGHFFRYNFPDSEPRRRLQFVFGAFDSTTLKMVRIELFESDLSFHKFVDARFIKANSTSGLNAVPSNWNNLDYENDTFILHYFELAGEVGGASGDRSSSQPTPVANLDSTQQGYGLQDITSSGTPSSLVATRTDVKTRLDNIYTKSESDLRYLNGDNFYLKTDADSKFATITNTNNELALRLKIADANSTFATITTTDGITTAIGTDSTSGTIKGRIKSNEDNITTNTSNITSIDTRVTSAESKINIAEGEIGTNRTGIDGLVTDVEALTIKVTTNETSINDINSNAFFSNQTNDGMILQCNNVQVNKSGTFQDVVTAEDFRQLVINSVETSPSGGQQLKESTVLVAGPNLVLPASPSPVLIMEDTGFIGSSTFSSSVFADQVFGAVNRGKDGDPISNNNERFEQGLLPRYEETVEISPGVFERIGSSVTVCTADGTWRKLSSILPTIESTPLLSAHLPDFNEVKATDTNKFARISTINGGTIFYSNINSDDVVEGTNNKFYTDERVQTKVQTALSNSQFTDIITNAIQTNELIATSDRRKKFDIKPLEKSIVNNLKPVSYKFKDKPHQQRIGLIAQEVQEIAPELVSEKDNYLGINYQDLTAYLIKEIQNLNKRIIQLEKKCM